MDHHSCWAAQSSKLGAQEKNIRILDPIQTANQRNCFFLKVTWVEDLFNSK